MAKHDELIDAIGVLAGQVREQGDQFVEYIRSLQETIEDLRTEIQHAVRNVLPEFQLKSMTTDPTDPQWAAKLNRWSDTIPETLACAECDCDSPDSLAAALQDGWTELSRDDGPRWNYLGLCPKCVEREIAEVAAMQEQPQSAPTPREVPMTLF